MAKKLGGGKRFNKGKLNLSDCPLSTQAAIAATFMINSKACGGKYENNNWREGMSWMVVANCAKRHLEKFIAREDIDDESYLPHLYHAITNLAMLIEYQETYPEGDDRYTGEVQQIEFANKIFSDALAKRNKIKE